MFLIKGCAPVLGDFLLDKLDVIVISVICILTIEVSIRTLIFNVFFAAK